MSIEELRAKILLYNAAYEIGKPIVEDCVYDFYKKQLALLEEGENMRISDSIGTLVSGKKNKHLHKILSLSHDFEKQSINEFVKKTERTADGSCFPFIGEPKIDGVSIVCRYIDGVLKNISTRGNGSIGEDITHIKNHINIPDKIFLKPELDIRFEAYLEKGVITNPRNAVAGMLLKKSIDPKLKLLKFAPHNLYSNEAIWNDYVELKGIFAALHLTNIDYAICNSIEEMEEWFDKIKAKRSMLNYEIDGVVFKINDKSLQDQLGATATAPRYAFAIKFDNMVAITKIINIIFQVGRFGKVVPVAKLEEAIINGRKINTATLNNLADLQKKQYAIGDIVKLEMAGEVIPMISQIIEKGQNATMIPIVCPSCNSTLEDDICQNGWNCPAQRLERLCNFVGKNGLNIEGVGQKQLEFFIKEGLLQFPCDLFKLGTKINEIKGSASWLGETALSNLLTAIEKAKHSSLTAFYCALGMPHIGRSKAQLLADKFDFDAFLNTTEEDLAFLGPTIAKDVHEFIHNENWINETYEQMQIGTEYAETLDLFKNL